MKPILQIAMVVLAISVSLASCKKEKKTTPTNSLPPIINTIVTQAQIDSLKKHGAVINEGTTPPNVSGEFLLEPDVCSFDNSGGGFSGQTFDSYVYKFSNQDESKFTVRVDYADVDGGDIGSDSTATYISGSGSLFTIFAQSSGVESNINYSNLEVISGQVVSGGIANMQVTDYLQSKGADPDGKLEPAGSTRIFYDSDLLSGPYTGSITLVSPKARSLNDLTARILAKAMRTAK